jgi:hypothetical protein
MGVAIRDHQANMCDVSIVHMAGGKVVEEQTSSALVLNRLPNSITCNLARLNQGGGPCQT